MTIEQLCGLSAKELLEWDDRRIEEHFAGLLPACRPDPFKPKLPTEVKPVSQKSRREAAHKTTDNLLAQLDALLKKEGITK